MTPDRIWGIIVAGISCLISASVGLVVWKWQRKEIKRQQREEELEAARIKYELMQIKLAMASLSLSEAVAEAIQRIPDAHCNGDMHLALESAKRIKSEYREFEAEQIAQSMHR